MSFFSHLHSGSLDAQLAVFGEPVLWYATEGGPSADREAIVDEDADPESWDEVAVEKVELGLTVRRADFPSLTQPDDLVDTQFEVRGIVYRVWAARPAGEDQIDCILAVEAA